MPDYPAISGVDDASQIRVALVQGKGIVHVPLLELPIQPLDATLTTIAALTGAADKGIYFTGADVAALYTQTSFARTLLDDADAVAARTTLGVAYELIGTVQIPSAVASIIYTGLSPYNRLRLSGSLLPVTNAVTLNLNYSEDNGATYKTGASDYYYLYHYTTHAGTIASGDANTSLWPLAVLNVVNTASLNGGRFIAEFDQWNKASRTNGNMLTFNYASTANYICHWGLNSARSVARDALRIQFSSGNIASGFVTLEGIRG